LEVLAEGTEIVGWNGEILGKPAVQLKSDSPQILADIFSSREAPRALVAGDVGIDDP
jgi:hypothetical protein